MNNIPNVKIGLVAVSRDCFVIELSEKRRRAVMSACKGSNTSIEEISVTVENEADVGAALKEIDELGVNALVILLGNFGPETPETMLAQKFDGPVMFVASAEESQDNLFDGRGDAYCGLLNASYNIGIRKLLPYIPESPVRDAVGVAEEIESFADIARAVIGVSKLKIISFGPRPNDFVACNAPIKPLFDLGVELMEKSELDLFVDFKEHENDERIADVAADMASELGSGNTHPDMLDKLAQYELTLVDFYEQNKGLSEYVVFANKCWPAFEAQFGFVPCYVNSRLAGRGIPVACEADIYGALSEYIAVCVTQKPPAFLDINNTVPQDMYDDNAEIGKKYKPDDLFMGFHCGNVSSGCLNTPTLKHQLIMHRLMESDSEPNITRGTLEGTIMAGDVTMFRLQSTADCELRSYIAQGEVLDIDPKSFGSIGVFAVSEMGRFYRHVLVEKRFPHHAAVAFGHTGKAMFEVIKMLGVTDIGFNQPSGMMYETENPYK
ncbi:MAG: fucose isomerase [Clostridia bacterium]|jgi:L-fucose isomerase-like protein|nr:fucose isomerase [Clostridia bacterium]MBT7122513.1 fucose isomerase [Clostridia bacterium]